MLTTLRKCHVGLLFLVIIIVKTLKFKKLCIQITIVQILFICQTDRALSSPLRSSVLLCDETRLWAVHALWLRSAY